jgi:2-polyprenyl-3-methyl-5-hydroxy-6-metoxy-1,4-benzoquinol methylase
VATASALNRLRELARSILPDEYLAGRHRRHQEQLRAELGITSLADRFARKHGTAVVRGPFAGLTYPERLLALTDAPVAKLVGAYERELHPFLPDSPATVVNIGCAEGFYAVGLATKGARVTAFELDPVMRRRCLELAAHNGAEVEVRPACSERDLLALDQPDFLFSDCEGAEAAIFTPRVVEHLSSTAVLVETHGTLELMARRFAGRPQTVVPAGERHSDYPELQNWSTEERLLAVDPFRTIEIAWLLIGPTASRSRRSGT